MLHAWTVTQYQVQAFRPDRVTRLALLLRFRTSEDCRWRAEHVTRVAGG